MTTFSENLHMPPPWMKYPSIPLGSIGWRMGNGESHLDAYRAWKSALSTEQCSEHERLFPEPFCWNPDISILQHGGDFWTYRWDSAVSPDLTGKRQKQDFLFFWGHQQQGQTIDKSCLSQWFLRNFYFDIDHYASMEQYMMSEKAKLFGDTASYKKIMKTDDPAKAKALGRKITPFDSALWDQFKLATVTTGNYFKFAQHADLRTFLMNTGDRILVEASPYDRIWGIGLAENDDRVNDPGKWRGDNLLGVALMMVRRELQRVWANAHRIDPRFMDKP